MSKIKLLALFVATYLFSSLTHAAFVSAGIEWVQVNESGSVVYVKLDQALGQTGCVGATQLYLSKSETSFEEMFAMIMSAKNQNEEIQVSVNSSYGSCVNSNSFANPLVRF